MDSFFDPTCVPVRVTINKLNFFPNGKIPRFVSVLRNRGGLRTSKPYISVVFFYPIMHRSPCFHDVYFAALTWNLLDDIVLIPCECDKVYMPAKYTSGKRSSFLSYTTMNNKHIFYDNFTITCSNWSIRTWKVTQVVRIVIQSRLWNYLELGFGRKIQTLTKKLQALWLRNSTGSRKKEWCRKPKKDDPSHGDRYCCQTKTWPGLNSRIVLYKPRLLSIDEIDDKFFLWVRLLLITDFNRYQSWYLLYWLVSDIDFYRLTTPGVYYKRDMECYLLPCGFPNKLTSFLSSFRIEANLADDTFWQVCMNYFNLS